MSALPIDTADLPMYARRNASGHYTWNGIPHPSVTTILDTIDGRGHLKPWYAKMTAEECAGLIAKRQAGILTLEECDEAILDVASRMTAAIRYRDHKAAIGSLVHHAIYERALGVSLPHENMQPYLEGHAIKLQLATDDEHEGESEPYRATLARAAIPYVDSAFKFLDELAPEFEMIGQEACVINETEGYAGTVDAIATFEKSAWTKFYDWKWGDRQRVRLTCDFKTSSAIDEIKHPMQVEAYRRAEFIGLVADGSQHEIPETRGTAIIWIRPEDPTTIKFWEPNDEVFEAFLAARQLYGVLNNMPKPNCIKRARAQRPTAGPRPCPF